MDGDVEGSRFNNKVTGGRNGIVEVVVGGVFDLVEFIFYSSSLTLNCLLSSLFQVFEQFVLIIIKQRK